ncbi:MAG: prenyltransferase [Deltaproteobacteria bacterium]|nr:prenyltransferase [Deltaproteobacteria bacterium]
MRLPFVILTPACVLLGLGTAVWTSGPVRVLHLILALAGAISAHISVNAFNEYFDFKSGLDFRTERTPFSGGSGTLPEKPSLARKALGAAIAAFIVTGLIGGYFLYLRGLLLLPLGALGLFILFAYTPWLAHNALLCLIAPGLGFGTLMVMGTHVVLTGEYSWTAFIASLVPFFLVSDLLLLNQFPDVDADKSIGRRNFPIVIGRRGSSFIYGAFLLSAYLAIVFGVCFDHLPKLSLIGLLTFFIALPVSINAYRYADNIEKLLPSMGLNVMINIATPVLVAIGLLFG